MRWPMSIRNFIYKYRYGIAVALALVFIAAAFILLQDQFSFLGDRESFQRFVESFGVWGPLVIISVIVLEVVIAPIPGFVPIAVAGFLFGPLEGAAYAYIGNVVGSILAFLLARKIGRQIVVRLMGAKRLQKYETMMRRRGDWLFAFYFFPVIPVDVLSMVFGLSGVSFKKFTVIMSIGFIAYIVALSFFGEYLAKLYF